MSMRATLTQEEGAYKIIVPLDPESARRLIGRLPELLKGVSNVEEVGDNYIVVKVPRLIGSRRARLDYRIYETEDTILLVAKGRVDSLIIAVDVVDTGEGAHIVISGGGAGGAAKIAGKIVRDVAEAIAKKLEEASPKVEIQESDNQLAALERQPPANTTLVYFDSFTPVHNVALEAAQRLLALLGFDDYLVEVSDYEGRYLLRMVIRGNKITGLYAETEADRFQGEQVLSLASRPPSYRVRIKAWSLTGSSEAYLYAPEVIYSNGGHQVYWLGGSSRLEYGLSSNTYAIVSKYEALVFDPSGGDRVVRGLRSVIADLDSIHYIVLSAAEPDTVEAVSAIASKAKKAIALATAYNAAILASTISLNRVKPVPLREQTIPLGDTQLHLIPSRAREPPTLTMYDERSRTLFTGVTLGAVSPPGLWTLFAEDLTVYEDMMWSYVKYAVNRQALKDWLERVSTLDVEVLAPKHGPILRGKTNVERILSILAGW
jgi:carbon monoxide dehydrogenase subunit G